MNEMLSSRKCQAKLVPLALLAALLLLAIIPLAASNLFIDNDRYLLGETVTITVDTEGIGQPQLWIHTSDGNFRFNGALDEQMQYTPANEGYYMITLRDRLDPSFTLEQNFTVTLKTPGNEEENRSGNTTGEAGSAMNVSGNTSENASETEHPLTVTLSTDKTAYSKGETVSIESDTIAEEDWLLYIKTPTEHFRYMGEMDFPLAFPTGAAGAYTIELRNVDGSLLDTLGFMVNTQETPQGDAEPVVPENITGENITAENVTEQNVTETIPLPLLEDETAMNTTENAMTEDPEENVSVEQSGPLTIMDSEGRQGWYVMWKRDPSFFAEVKEFIGLGEADEVKVGETTDVEIIVGSGIIGSMQLDQLQIEDGLRIGVDEVPEENVDELPGRVSNSFALDFSDANFTNGTVTKVAEGQELWKCADWNFTQQRCLGTWVKQQELTPGQEYSFAVYPGDPGYVEILITTAQHLDENRSFIEDIYTEVESRDGVWKEIPANNYVRVTFETELQSFNDITIYARSSSSGRVEVYEKNGTEKLADFGVISEDRKYRILLTNLTGNQDTFDLRVVGGSVEFDYIVDPSTISFDALTSEINPSPFTGIDTVTFSHTTTTDSDRVLVVFVQWLEVSNAYSVDNVSYGGVGLTQLNTEYELAGSRSAAIESWYLVNPPSGANNVVVDWAGSTRNTAVFALTYKGVDQTTPVASNVSAASGGDSATSTVNIDTTNADSLIVAGATHHGGDTDPFSPGSTIVERYDTASGTDTGNHAGFTGGQKTASAVGTHNMNFTASVSDGWVIAAVALNPGNIAPTQSQPIISSSSGTNSSNENLTCSNQSTSDADGDPVKNIYNWYLNSSSLFILNTPFEGGSNSTWTRDYSDNVNHGAVSGATWNATGGYDGWGAYEFDGTNDYIQFQGDDLSTTSSPFSVEFWFTPTTTINSGIGSNIALIEKREGSGANDWYINFESSDVGRMRWRSYSGNVQTTQATWTAGTWYHIVMVYVSNTNATIYVDGVVDNRNSDYDIGSLVQSAEDIWVGTRYDGNDDFDGSIDELRIWNKSLSTEQVFALYQNKTNTIVSEETDIDDVWMCGITPNDGVVDGNQSNSSAMTI
ncbi:LamG domain-containing protein, partial [Candidatus Woesearchaeota archaeon]|nr:LamG domain-containing protein [Candidatus Woesearchaeota archaeon]